MAQPTENKKIPNSTTSDTASVERNTLATFINNQANGQDFVKSGKSTGAGEPYSYMIVTDGHGTNIVINALRQLPWDVIIDSANIIGEINKRLNLLFTLGSGATLSIVKVFEDRFECEWVGDSTIVIFDKDHHILFKSRDHNSSNPDEEKRLQHIRAEVSWKPIALNSKRITVETNKTYHFAYRDILNMTRSLGHGNLVSCESDKVTLERTKGDKYRVVVATDGLWDILCDDDYQTISQMTTQEIGELANQRWTQTWEYTYQGRTDMQTFPEGDDVGIATWGN